MSVAARAAAGAGAGAALHAAVGRRLRLPRPPRTGERRVLAALATGAAVEELLWRGPAFRALAARLGAPVTVAATATAFAAWHGIRPPQEAVALAAVGAAFGAIALAGGLVAAVAAHVAYDLLVVLEPEFGP